MCKNQFGIFKIILIATIGVMQLSAQTLQLPSEIDGLFVSIPEGSVLTDDKESTCSAFYLYKHEISNKEYNLFLESLEKSGQSDALAVAKRKSDNWNGYVEQSESYAKLYGTHETYENYPVVNISIEGAGLYCKWLSSRLTSNYGNQYNIEVRLPTRVEWVRASRPKNLDDVYTWGGSFLLSNTGEVICNFKRLGPENIYWDALSQSYQVKEEIDISEYSRRIKDSSTGIKSVDSFIPNKFGLLNMNGNAAELTSEGLACGGSWNSAGYDVRNESYVSYTKPLPTIGFRPVLVITSKS